MVLRRSNSTDDHEGTTGSPFLGFIITTIATIVTAAVFFNKGKISSGSSIFLIIMILCDIWSFVIYLFARRLAKKSRDDKPHQIDNYRGIETPFLIGFVLTTILTIVTAIICFKMVEKSGPVSLIFSILMILCDIESFVIYLFARRLAKKSRDNNTLYQTDNYIGMENRFLVGFVLTAILTIVAVIIIWYKTAKPEHISSMPLMLMISCNLWSFVIYLFVRRLVKQDNTLYQANNYIDIKNPFSVGFVFIVILTIWIPVVFPHMAETQDAPMVYILVTLYIGLSYTIHDLTQDDVQESIK